MSADPREYVRPVHAFPSIPESVNGNLATVAGSSERLRATADALRGPGDGREEMGLVRSC
jgi:hypothetical protein